MDYAGLRNSSIFSINTQESSINIFGESTKRGILFLSFLAAHMKKKRPVNITTTRGSKRGWNASCLLKGLCVVLH